MATKQKPKMRYSDSELGLIKSVFNENQPILTAMRKVFFQLEISDKDKEILKPITDSPEVKALLRKTYFPEIEVETPIGQVIDLWLTVDSKELAPDQARTALLVRTKLREFILNGLERFDNDFKITGKIVDWQPDFKQDDETLNAEFVARNGLITHSEFQLSQLSFLAERKEETPEQAKKRLEMNSTK